MGIQTKEVKYAKEIGDVCVFTNKLIKTIKNKGDYASVMPELVAAIEKVEEVDDEFKENRAAALATVGYHSGELIDSLLPAQEA